MVRLRVISLKDTYNRILKLSLYIIIFFIILTFLKNISSKDSIIDVKIDVENDDQNLIMKDIIEYSFLCFREINKDENNNVNKELEKIEIIKSLIDIPCFKEIDLNKENNNIQVIATDDIKISNEINEPENVIEENSIIIEENEKESINIEGNEYVKVNTSVVPEKNKIDKYTTQIHGIKIRNESKYLLNTNNVDLSYKIKNKENIIIYHTHTCESYTPTEKYNYIQTGNYRSTDLNFTVSKVGDVLERYLLDKNYKVSHLKDYHDFPAYNGSYDRARKTIEEGIKNFPSDIVLDIHRDAIGDNSSYGPTVMIGEEKVAQLMMVIGTNGGGLKHNNWTQNLNFAVGLQKKAEELYPGLFKPIIVRNVRYNQHVAGGAVIIEVGATGNTLEEAEGAMKYLSIVLDEYIKGT